MIQLQSTVTQPYCVFFILCWYIIYLHLFISLVARDLGYNFQLFNGCYCVFSPEISLQQLRSLNLCPVDDNGLISLVIFMNSRLFPMGAGRKTTERDLLRSLHTYSFCLVLIHTSDHTRTPVARTTHLFFLKNLTNKVNSD